MCPVEPCSVLGTQQGTRPLPLWRSDSYGGSQTRKHNKKVKYIIVQSDKCYEEKLNREGKQGVGFFFFFLINKVSKKGLIEKVTFEQRL